MLIASTPPTVRDSRIEYIAIPPLTLRGYNIFMLKTFYRYLQTSHALTVHPDGYVLNPSRWNPQWLTYDYIGAPWREQLRADKYIIEIPNRVGNSGFALRSRRLMELTARVALDELNFPVMADDVITCAVLYDDLIELGMRFPDVETAARFSIETPSASFGQTLNTAFGFHGRHYLRELMAAEGKIEAQSTK